MEPRRAYAWLERAPGGPPSAAARPAGRLHVYLGAIPLAGTTHAMLAEGSRLAALGVDVVIGQIAANGHERPDDAGRSLERLPARRIEARAGVRCELDTEAVLARHPAVVLVDELAHSNARGSLRAKRWQDIDVLLRAGIDVVTTLSIAHLAELHDAVEQITGVPQRDFVPETVVLAADRVDFIDTEPRIAARRLAAAAGPHRPAGPAACDLDRLDLLRRLARTWLADHDPGPARHAVEAGMASQPGAVVVAVEPGAPAQPAVCRAARLAALRHAPLVGVGVRGQDAAGSGGGCGAPDLRRALAEAGGGYAEVAGADAAWELTRFAAREGAAVLVIGGAPATPGRRAARGSLARRVPRLAGPVEVWIVPAPPGGCAASPAAGRPLPGRPRAAAPRRRRVLGWLLLAAALAALAAGHLAGVLALIMLAVAGTAIGAGGHVLAGRAARAARSRADADRLARLLARAIAEPPTSTGPDAAGGAPQVSR
jgi:two-component system, OmpR family, sensor histidine kinase KdpD